MLGHPLRIDPEHKIVSWSPASSPYADIAGRAWHALETKFPVQDNGLPTYLGWSRFDPVTFEGVSWPHNPAGLYGMLAESALLWYRFSGDQDAIALVRRALDYQLDHGMTPRDWHWAGVPYASAGAGDTDYSGADDAWCDYCGRGDGIGVVEPDKIGELGFAYLQFYELTGNTRYREAALACANALASHVREGDDERSPWPFRVYAQTNVIREEYSANVVGALTLFDELVRLRLGDVDAYGRARGLAFEWLMRVPMRNDAWSGYFEDIEIHRAPEANPNQYAPMRVARWLLLHPEVDPDWKDHVEHLLSWVEMTFGGDTDKEQGIQWGAIVLSEQQADMVKMGSHTARFGATTALWAAATGDDAALDRAARSLNWATYTCSEDGVVAVGEDKNEGWWFSDGYGDYIRHFLVAVSAVPQWAPAREIHLLESTSLVTHADYSPSRVSWTTFDADATETLRLPTKPTSVTMGGAPLDERKDLAAEGYTVRALRDGDYVVRVRHDRMAEVIVETGTPEPAPAPSASGGEVEWPTPSSGCGVGGAGSGGWGLGIIALALVRRNRRR
jgi:MYXO-CTERM domain-containing protein